MLHIDQQGISDGTSGPDKESISLPAIGGCPESLERCIIRVLDLLSAYWEEFRRPEGSDLLHACRKFKSAARAGTRAAAETVPYSPARRNHAPDHAPSAHPDTDRFIAVLNRAIQARHRADGTGVRQAIEALDLASRLVQNIPWGRLSDCERQQNHDLLKWTVRQIDSMRKGCNDRSFARLLRRVIRLDPTFLDEIRQEIERHGSSPSPKPDADV